MQTAARRRMRTHQLMQSCTKAVARALKRGAETLPYGTSRARIVNQARRLNLCALTSYARITSVPGEGICFRTSNKRECRHRLCPLGERARAREERRHVRALLDHIWGTHPEPPRAIFLTLTTRSRPVDQLGAMWRDHDAAVKRFFACKRIKTAIHGHYTRYEVTIGGSKDAPTAHVHSHSLLLVDPGFFLDRRYIRQTEYVALWRASAKLTYKPVVDVRAVKSAEGATDTNAVTHGCAELTKYVTKPASIFQLNPNGSVHVDERVAVALALGLYRRRICRYDRIFAEATKAVRKQRT